MEIFLDTNTVSSFILNQKDGANTMDQMQTISTVSKNLGTSSRMLRYYEERAKGGAGLVTIEATSVDPTGNSFSRGLSIADDARLP